MRAATARLLSLGSVNHDIQVRADRWPEAGETMPARDLMRALGGKAANRAIAARRLGAPAALFGRVGGDDLGEAALRSLHAADVEVSHVRAVRGATTGVALIVVRADGDKTILLAPGANLEWDEGDIEVVRGAVSGAPPGSVLALDLEASPALVHAAARAARERGFRVVLDPSPAARMSAALYPLVDFITPNPSEAATLTGVTIDDAGSARRAGEILRERGVGAACVKLGAGGCVLVGADVQAQVPALKVTVVDKTGAGDAFAAALAVAVMEGATPTRAAALASVAASIAVTGYGSQSAYPDRARLERGLAELPHQR